jgi:hypothetical protein
LKQGTSPRFRLLRDQSFAHQKYRLNGGGHLYGGAGRELRTDLTTQRPHDFLGGASGEMNTATLKAARTG